MYRIFGFLLFFAGILFFPLLLAAAPVSYTLDQIIEQGLKSNLHLQKDVLDLSMAGYSANRLWSEIFPAISASVGASYDSKLISGFEPNKDDGRFNASLGLNFSFNAGIPYARRNIALAYQTKMLNYNDAKNQLEIQLTKDFFRLITEHENISVLKYILNSAQLLFDRNQTAFRNGLINELTLMQSRLGLENARYGLSVAQSIYKNQMDSFLTQIGISYNEEITFEGTVHVEKIELDSFKLISEYLPKRPDIIAKLHEIERLENAAKQINLSTRAPSLSLSAQWRASDFRPFTDTLSGSALINIPIDPLIPGTTRNQSIRAARLAAEKAQIDLQIAKDDAASEIRSLASNLNNFWDSIEIARLSLQAAELSYELTTQGFRGGVADSMKLEDARNDLLNAHQRLLVTELAYFNMILDISAALNINWKELMK